MSTSPAIINPVLHGFHPDPSWMWHNSKAWLVTSSFGLVPGLPIYTSPDFIHWHLENSAIDENIAKRLFLAYIDSDNRGIFAPSIRMINDLMVIVSTVVTVDVQRALNDGINPAQLEAMQAACGNFALVSQDEGQSWQGPFWIHGARGNDPDIFLDNNGTVWWVCSHQSDNPQWQFQSDIVISKLNTQTWSLEGPEHILWHGALEGATWAESPHILQHDGWYYLLAAEAGTERHHAQSVARSHELTTPYEGNPRNPILTHRHLGESFPVQNVGHCDLLQDDNGRWWGICLGSRTVNGYSFMGREPFIFPVTWEHDWPVFAPNSGIVQRIIPTQPTTDQYALSTHTTTHATDYDSHAVEHIATNTTHTDANTTPRWSTTVIDNQYTLRLPWQRDWQWTKVTDVDFSIIANPHTINEARIQQDRTRYAAIEINQQVGTVRALIHNEDTINVLYEGTLTDNTDYAIRLNGATVEFLAHTYHDMHNKLDNTTAVHHANTIPTKNNFTHSISTNTPALVIQRGTPQTRGIAAGGYPIYCKSNELPDNCTLLAQIDASFLSTEVAGGYLGCLGGAHFVSSTH